MHGFLQETNFKSWLPIHQTDLSFTAHAATRSTCRNLRNIWQEVTGAGVGCGGGVVGVCTKSHSLHGSFHQCISIKYVAAGLRKCPLWLGLCNQNWLTWLYRYCNDIHVHFISAGCPTLTRTRWGVACHSWRRTNRTWQNWVGISILLIKRRVKSKKTFLKGHSVFYLRKYEACSTAVFQIKHFWRQCEGLTPARPIFCF